MMAIDLSKESTWCWINGPIQKNYFRGNSERDWNENTRMLFIIEESKETILLDISQEIVKVL